MSVDMAIRDLVLGAVRDALPQLLAELGRPRLLSIRDLPVSHRLVLDAERAGEIRVYRRGKFSAVDEIEFTEWVRRAPTTPRTQTGTTAEPDVVDELIQANERRRAHRGSRA